MLSEASELAERFDDDLLVARIAELRGHSVLYRGDLPAAIELLEEARTRFRALREPLGEFDTLVLLAAATFFLEDPRDGDFSHRRWRSRSSTAPCRRRPMRCGASASRAGGSASTTGPSRTCGSACGCSNPSTT